MPANRGLKAHGYHRGVALRRGRPAVWRAPAAHPTNPPRPLARGKRCGEFFRHHLRLDWCGHGAAGAGEKSQCQQPADVVEIRIDHRNRQQRQQQRQRLAADGQHGDRAALFGAGAGGDQAAAAGRRRRRSSSSGSAAGGRGWPAGSRRSRFMPLRAQDVGVIDLQDRRLLHHAEQHQDAQRRIEVQRLAAPVQADQAERHGQRQREQDREADAPGARTGRPARCT